MGGYAIVVQKYRLPGQARRACSSACLLQTGGSLTTCDGRMQDEERVIQGELVDREAWRDRHDADDGVMKIVNPSPADAEDACWPSGSPGSRVMTWYWSAL